MDLENLSLIELFQTKKRKSVPSVPSDKAIGKGKGKHGATPAKGKQEAGKAGGKRKNVAKQSFVLFE